MKLSTLLEASDELRKLVLIALDAFDDTTNAKHLATLSKHEVIDVNSISFDIIFNDPIRLVNCKGEVISKPQNRYNFLFIRTRAAPAIAVYLRDTHGFTIRNRSTWFVPDDLTSFINWIDTTVDILYLLELQRLTKEDPKVKFLNGVKVIDANNIKFDDSITNLIPNVVYASIDIMATTKDGIASTIEQLGLHVLSNKVKDSDGLFISSIVGYKR